MRFRFASVKILLILMLSLPVLLINAADFKLDQLLAEQNKLWQNSPKTFVAKCGWTKFKWNSAKKNSLYYSAVKGGKLMLGKSRIIEIVARFSDKRLQRLEISLYNRGDAGDVTVKVFEHKLMTVRTYLNQLLDYDRTPEKLRKRLAGSKIFHSIWETKFAVAKLRWSLSKFNRTERPEFISLYLYSPNGKMQSAKASVSKKLLPERVQHDKDGGKYLELPMVDQGAKGYCVVAVLERVMKYYGSDIDQHMLAELVSASAAYGTSLKEMVNALKEADHKLGVKFKLLYQNQAISEYSSFTTLIKRYNKLARKAGNKRLKIDKFTASYEKQRYYDPLKFLHVVNPDIYADVRMKYYRSDSKRFFRDIEKYITLGIPVLWSVQLGIFPEQGKKQSNGGHLRLIVGFNKATETIFYSDTWGKGHELKKMPYKQAWAMSTGLYLMPPRFQR
ncbi:MAG: C39 family peptidase [Victivallaceae bacterium]|nr:C39 family peptidase [Victivallaceae bacterium]